MPGKREHPGSPCLAGIIGECLLDGIVTEVEGDTCKTQMTQVHNLDSLFEMSLNQMHLNCADTFMVTETNGTLFTKNVYFL